MSRRYSYCKVEGEDEISWRIGKPRSRERGDGRETGMGEKCAVLEMGVSPEKT